MLLGFHLYVLQLLHQICTHPDADFFFWGSPCSPAADTHLLTVTRTATIYTAITSIVCADPKWRFFWRVGERPSDGQYAELNAEPVVPQVRQFALTCAHAQTCNARGRGACNAGARLHALTCSDMSERPLVH
jgi:hypothetical protein